jgi:hypothetical protein
MVQPLDLMLPKTGANVDNIDEDYSEDEKKTRKKTKSQHFMAGKSQLHVKIRCERPIPKARTIEVLQRMAKYYNRGHDHWRSIAYRRAHICTSKSRYQDHDHG